MSHTDHYYQALYNLQFLESICSQYKTENWDWKVTILFYSAVRLLRYHITQQTGRVVLTHYEADNILNPYNTDPDTTKARLQNYQYSAYNRLKSLSENARYDQAFHPISGHACCVHHFADAMNYAEKLFEFWERTYTSMKITPIKVFCSHPQSLRMNYFVFDTK